MASEKRGAGRSPRRAAGLCDIVDGMIGQRISIAASWRAIDIACAKGME
jgi:hypothetical protein